jgi:integrase
MNRPRKITRTLTGSRIYVRRGKYQYFSQTAVFNPDTGKSTKWLILCSVDEGELAARQKLAEVLGHIKRSSGSGDFSVWFDKWRQELLKKRTAQCPADTARARVWKDGTKGLLSVLSKIEHAFADFDVTNVLPADVAQFVDQWAGRRSAQSYRGHLVKFFAWCARRGILNTNPAREISVETPQKRDVYITDDQYLRVSQALLIGDDNKPTRTGPMVKCYMDLLYLFYQRGIEIRLLRWDQVTPEGILFKPTKTERSSGTKVLIPIGEDARAVLAKAKALRKMISMYVIHTEHGQPYTSHGIGSLFKRACKRAGIKGITLKDIRAKAATDAKSAGYSEDEVKVALAHTDAATTRDYIRQRDTPVSSVILKLPN